MMKACAYKAKAILITAYAPRRYLSAILAWRRGLLDGLRHGDPTHRYFCGIFAWQDCLEPVSNRTLAGTSARLRHGTPVHRYARAISPWRRGLLAGFWHGDPAHRYLSAILAWRTGNLLTLLPDLRPYSWPLRLGCVLGHKSGHDSGLNPGH